MARGLSMARSLGGKGAQTSKSLGGKSIVIRSRGADEGGEAGGAGGEGGKPTLRASQLRALRMDESQSHGHSSALHGAAKAALLPQSLRTGWMHGLPMTESVAQLKAMIK